MFSLCNRVREYLESNNNATHGYEKEMVKERRWESLQIYHLYVTFMDISIIFIVRFISIHAFLVALLELWALSSAVSHWSSRVSSVGLWRIKIWSWWAREELCCGSLWWCEGDNETIFFPLLFLLLLPSRILPCSLLFSFGFLIFSSSLCSSRQSIFMAISRSLSWSWTVEINVNSWRE